MHCNLYEISRSGQFSGGQKQTVPTLLMGVQREGKDNSAVESSHCLFPATVTVNTYLKNINRIE